jgi:SecD/SecF fusion protein
MNERDLWWKIVIVGALAALAFASVYPIDTKIKYGIDLRGGYSLLYEIDDSGLGAAEKQDLAERVMRVLRERVDPKGVYNLVWRPVGHNRLEIQMPRPSDQVMTARAEFEQAQEQIQDTIVRRSMIIRAISKPEDQRPAALAELVHGIEKRRPVLQAAADAYDALQNMKEAYEARAKEIEADNISKEQIEAAVKVSPEERPAALEALIHDNPDRKPLLEAAAKAWDEYSAAKDAYEAAQADAAAEGPQTVTAQEVSTKLQAFNRAVRTVLDVNVDPNLLKEGPTIDKVVELDENLDKAIADVLATNIDVGKLQTILELKPTDELREQKLSEMKEAMPGLSELLSSLVEANDALKMKRRSGEGRLEDPADLQRLLRGAGVLEFRILADPDELRGTEKLNQYIEDLKTRGPRKRPGEQEYQWFEVEDPGGDRGFFHIKDLARDFEDSEAEPRIPRHRRALRRQVLRARPYRRGIHAHARRRPVGVVAQERQFRS